MTKKTTHVIIELSPRTNRITLTIHGHGQGAGLKGEGGGEEEEIGGRGRDF